VPDMVENKAPDAIHILCTGQCNHHPLRRRSRIRKQNIHRSHS